jgi:uncharacterized protein (DUF302 family)
MARRLLVCLLLAAWSGPLRAESGPPVCRDPTSTEPSAMDSPDGLVTATSGLPFAETVARLTGAIRAGGGTVFAEIDHAGGAAEAGLSLRPTRLIIFGNARAGTPLMQAAPTAGLDLPLKILIWEEGGTVRATYSDPAWIAKRHGLAPDLPPVKGMSEALARIVAAAR